MSLVNYYFSNQLSKLQEQFIRAAIAGDADEAKRLIEQDANVVNFKDERTGLTGLMIFAADGCASMVKHICDVPETNVALEDTHGRTAGFIAMTIGRGDIEDLIDDRLTQDLLAREPDLLTEVERSQNGNTSSAQLIKFPGPKGGSDPSP